VTAVAVRIARLGPTGAVALAAGCGGTLALAQPPLSWWPAIFLALPPLFWLFAAAPGVGAGFRLGWAAGAGYFVAGLFWIVEPFLVDPARHGWMAPFALVLMGGGLALFWGAGFAVAGRLWRPGLRGAVILAACWTLAEYARAHVLTGFPWGLIAYAWIETPVVQAVAAIGPHGLGFVTLMLGLAPAAAAQGTGRRAGLAVAAAALSLAALWGLGAARLAAPLPQRADPVTVRLVQPNIPQHLKWRPELQQEFYERHLHETLAPAEPRPDITIWPETAVAFALGDAPAVEAEIARAAAPGLAAIGVQRRAEDGGWRNALAVLGPNGVPLAVYDKHRLVPFGEYVPMAGALARIGLPGLAGLAGTGFAAGPGPETIAVPGLPRFLALVCYEAIFPHLMHASGPRPEWIVQVTNDAWFGQASGPYQHLAQARSRAIEQGLPLARAANTGISAMIGPRGEIVEALPLGVAGHLDAALPAALGETIYARFGDLPIVLVVFTILLLTASNFRRSVSSQARR